ncbi:MAG TPA: hypothetical protein VFT44_16215 [Pyrinomonadaceae bacterium]|nr:hypothetical protein [Pyrinomonadaceae bacterium]
MKVLLDVTEQGWSGIQNGELLNLAATKFDVFLTVDQNLSFQQNIKNFNIAIILMVARNNRLKTLLPLMPAVRAAVDEVKAGEIVRISGS